MLPWLNPEELGFPEPESALADPNGLLAYGGDLSVDRLLLAYSHGIFPWFGEDEPILWWSPAPRCVLFPDQVHISKSLKKRLKRGDYQIRCNTAFIDVISACATTPRKDGLGTWINDDMIAAYSALHEQGFAHSIETWHENQLIGGLYGVAIGRVFFGESMFSRAPDASKVALISLAKQLKKWNFSLIDCQVSNPHLISLGAVEISRSEFQEQLKTNRKLPETLPVDWKTYTEETIDG